MWSRAESVDISAVSINDSFWTPRIETNRSVTIEYQYDQLESSGCLENFRRAAAGDSGGFQGFWFADTDAYKWIEAASYVLASDEDSDLETRVDDVIELVAAAQEADGYLNTYFTLEEPDRKWTNLHMMHELYCAGHLFEAAAAHYRATGKETLLDVATDFADHIDDVFGDEIDGVPGHEEVELGLVKLARVTGEDDYVELARYFNELRGGDDRLAWEVEHADEIGGQAYGTGEGHADEIGGEGHEGMAMAAHSRRLFCEDGEYDGSYAQAHAPFFEQEKVEGHAVRAMYFFTGIAEVAKETGDDELTEHLETLWENMTTKRMYVTGGIGSAHEGERFTEDYDLPNDTAYAETCAAIGSIFWNQRMFELTGDRKYADLIERTLYNGFLAGVSLDGTEFFYDNVLESDGSHTRQGWFDCACCPPNIARMLASLERYLYATTDHDLYVNQYMGSTATPELHGTDIEIEQTTDYPWDGSVTIDIDAAEPTVFALHLRVPEWCSEASVEVNGDPVEVGDEEYITLERAWDTDRIDVTFEQSVTVLRSHPAVEANAGRVALKRGPLVYCLEETDNERPLHQYAVDPEANVEATYRDDLLDGVVTLDVEARAPSMEEWEGDLYRPDETTDDESETITAVPYYAWDNRETGEMRVWLHTP
ncbi:MAG: glycoside hydrolase family 127 protein [Haloarculaceae archaeon]